MRAEDLSVQEQARIAADFSAATQSVQAVMCIWQWQVELWKSKAEVEENLKIRAIAEAKSACLLAAQAMQVANEGPHNRTAMLAQSSSKEAFASVAAPVLEQQFVEQQRAIERLEKLGVMARVQSQHFSVGWKRLCESAINLCSAGLDLPLDAVRAAAARAVLRDGSDRSGMMPEWLLPALLEQAADRRLQLQALRAQYDEWDRFVCSSLSIPPDRVEGGLVMVGAQSKDGVHTEPSGRKFSSRPEDLNRSNTGPADLSVQEQARIALISRRPPKPVQCVMCICRWQVELWKSKAELEEKLKIRAVAEAQHACQLAAQAMQVVNEGANNHAAMLAQSSSKEAAASVAVSVSELQSVEQQRAIERLETVGKMARVQGQHFSSGWKRLCESAINLCWAGLDLPLDAVRAAMARAVLRDGSDQSGIRPEWLVRVLQEQAADHRLQLQALGVQVDEWDRFVCSSLSIPPNGDESEHVDWDEGGLSHERGHLLLDRPNGEDERGHLYPLGGVERGHVHPPNGGDTGRVVYYA